MLNVRPFEPMPLSDFSCEPARSRMKEALQKVGQQLGREIPVVIGGEKRFLNEKFESKNPAQKEETVVVAQKAGLDEVEECVQVAQQAFSQWSAVAPEERAGLLLRAAQIARKRIYELAAWQVYEVGKNWLEAEADVAEGIDYMEYYAREMLRYAAGAPLTPIPTEINEYRYIPLGVVVVIPPWNFPFAILAGMCLGAIVTGNTVVVKPASDSPGVGYTFVEIMEEAGVPPGVLNFLTGPGGTVGRALVEHPGVRMVAFTGSKEAGIDIYERASRVRNGQKWLKRVIAEMGGKDAIIVDEDADLQDAASAIVASAFGYQGQKCSACSRLIVVEKVYDELLQLVEEKTRALRLGPPVENYPVGPVINARQEEKILNYIELGKNEGRLLVGGRKAERSEGYYIEPTIFVDVQGTARIAQEEIFGPVLSVIRVRDLDEALQVHNSVEYGLTGSYFGRDRARIERVKKEMHCGNLYINRKCTGAVVGVHPFGGFNMSGTDAKTGGPEYLLYFLQAKAISEKIA